LHPDTPARGGEPRVVRRRGRPRAGVPPPTTSLELEAQVVAVVEDEADRAEDRADDPEPDHDLRRRPRLQLEVMMDRDHQEDALARPLEGRDLADPRYRLEQEHARDA